MCGWGDSEIKYYLIGNPLIWWGSTAGMIVLLVSVGVYTVRRARGAKDFLPHEWDNFLFASKVGLLGWFLHYIPFYIMGRVMYVHHYFPGMIVHSIDDSSLFRHDCFLRSRRSYSFPSLQAIRDLDSSVHQLGIHCFVHLFCRFCIWHVRLVLLGNNRSCI
jgi:dolichyl-phosphate-mannose--protein O-mannosyl transferase